MEAASPNTATVKGRASLYKFKRVTNIQSIECYTLRDREKNNCSFVLPSQHNTGDLTSGHKTVGIIDTLSHAHKVISSDTVYLEMVSDPTILPPTFGANHKRL